MRFLIQPVYELPVTGGVVFLPESIPEHFGVASVLRSRKGLVATTASGVPPYSDDESWYEIALGFDQCREMRRLRKSVLVEPIFRRGGTIQCWLSKFATDLDVLKL